MGALARAPALVARAHQPRRPQPARLEVPQTQPPSRRPRLTLRRTRITAPPLPATLIPIAAVQDHRRRAASFNAPFSRIAGNACRPASRSAARRAKKPSSLKKPSSFSDVARPAPRHSDEGVAPRAGQGGEQPDPQWLLATLSRGGALAKGGFDLRIPDRGQRRHGTAMTEPRPERDRVWWVRRSKMPDAGVFHRDPNWQGRDGPFPKPALGLGRCERIARWGLAKRWWSPCNVAAGLIGSAGEGRPCAG